GEQRRLFELIPLCRHGEFPAGTERWLKRRRPALSSRPNRTGYFRANLRRPIPGPASPCPSTHILRKRPTRQKTEQSPHRKHPKRDECPLQDPETPPGLARRILSVCLIAFLKGGRLRPTHGIAVEGRVRAAIRLPL